MKTKSRAARKQSRPQPHRNGPLPHSRWGTFPTCPLGRGHWKRARPTRAANMGNDPLGVCPSNRDRQRLGGGGSCGYEEDLPPIYPHPAAAATRGTPRLPARRRPGVLRTRGRRRNWRTRRRSTMPVSLSTNATLPTAPPDWSRGDCPTAILCSSRSEVTQSKSSTRPRARRWSSARAASLEAHRIRMPPACFKAFSTRSIASRA